MANDSKTDLQELMEQVHVCIESSHNEQVQLEAVQYNDLIDKILNMNLKIGVIKQAPLTSQKLSDYNAVIIGSPKESKFTSSEIEEIRQYVFNGGGLFLIGDQGGDVMNKNNLSSLAEIFGIRFNPNLLIDPNSASEEDKQLVSVTNPYNHFVMRGIEKIALKSTCSLKVFKIKDAEPNAIAFSQPNIEELTWDGTQWVEAAAKKHPVVAVSKYGAGKVIAIGTTRILSSLINVKYGFAAADNEKFIVNCLAWLVNREVYESGKLKSVFVNVSLKPDLYFWIENELTNNDKFRDFNEVINFSIDSVKRGLEKFRKTKK
jgi:ABC-type uncharacterized transport system involved in gliding motility auxiliary subunit